MKSADSPFLGWLAAFAANVERGIGRIQGPASSHWRVTLKRIGCGLPELRQYRLLPAGTCLAILISAGRGRATVAMADEISSR